MMIEKRPTCPECGYPLSLTMEVDDETKEILIDCFCEGPADDEFHIQIQTGLTQDDLEDLDTVGVTLPVKLILMERQPDPTI